MPEHVKSSSVAKSRGSVGREDLNPALRVEVSTPTIGPWVTDRLFFPHSGEELPILRHWKSWVPAPLVLRYVLETARHRLAPGSLELHLRALGLMFRWSETEAGLGNFESHLQCGGLLKVEQFKALRLYLELAWDGDAIVESSAFAAHRRGVYEAEEPLLSCSNRTFNQRILAVHQFLEWAVWPMNHGGARRHTEDAIELFLGRITRQLNLKRVSSATRAEPLTPYEIRLIRLAVGPDKFGRFRNDVFDVTTRLRNYAMFEFAFNYGPRKSEMLTVQLTHVPGPSETHRQHVTIPRQQNAPRDRRKSRRPRGKTVAREHVPPLDPGAFTRIRKYVTSPFPLGRHAKDVATPYLFVTSAGVELHVSTADRVIKKIGKYAAKLAAEDAALPESQRGAVVESLGRLTWHRIRHTWAEQTAYKLYKKHGADGEKKSGELLANWGGWKVGSDSVHGYCANAERKIAETEADEYHAAYFEHPA
jgi:hypothetical protein